MRLKRNHYKLRARLPGGEVIERLAYNTVVDEGALLLLNIAVDLTPTKWTKYYGFVGTAGFTAIAKTDTLASHPGWLEEEPFDYRADLAYIGQVVAADGLSATTTNEEAAVTTDYSVDVRGLFMCYDWTSTGPLFSVGEFETGPVSLPAGSEIDVTYIATLYSG